MKVFLDVGSHRGQTLTAVLEKNFDKVHCFEPISMCWPELARLSDKRVTVHKFGLWNKSGQVSLIDPGTKGAGLWIKDKRRPDLEIKREACQFKRASEWFAKYVSADDDNYLKLNCEGCECDILDDLLDSGEFVKVKYVMIDFDVSKISSMKHRQAEILERLTPYPAPRVFTSKQVMIGDTHKARIHNWLGMLPA